MTPWEDPQSVAFGILDDETYDWVALCEAMQSSGGSSHIVQDETICEAKEIAEGMGINVCHTGAAGLAGLLEHRRRQGTAQADGCAPDLVILSGLDREKA
jgi:threonine synthase